MERKIQNRNGLFLKFIDLKPALDTRQRDVVCKCLEKLNTSKIHLVQMDGKKVRGFTMEKGIKKGDRVFLIVYNGNAKNYQQHNVDVELN